MFLYFPQQEYFTACLEHVKSYPQFYSIQEITSLTSVKFVCEMSLNFEKQLLAMVPIHYSYFCIINLKVWMWYTAVCFIYVYCYSPQGKIDILDKKVIPEDTQLAVDYETVSNVLPPAKKATSAQTVRGLSVIVWFLLSIFVVFGLYMDEFQIKWPYFTP